MTIIKIRIAQMNPTVDWMWYTAICHNNVNAGFGACYLIAQFQNHQKEHFKGRFEAHIPKDESLVVALKLTVLFFFFFGKEFMYCYDVLWKKLLLSLVHYLVYTQCSTKGEAKKTTPNKLTIVCAINDSNNWFCKVLQILLSETWKWVRV